MENSIGSEVTMRKGDAPTLGQVDQYVLVRELDGGGFGSVYSARDTVSGVDVTLTPVPAWVTDDENASLLFRRWFSRTSRLHHPGIASPLLLHKIESAEISSPAREEGFRPGAVAAVAPLSPGVPLSRLRHRFSAGARALPTAIEIAGQLAAALDYAHSRGVTHGCLRPENIVVEGVDGDGKALSVRMVDFGFEGALLQASAESTTASAAGGDAMPCNRTYFSPEVWQGDFGAAADQYALAAIVYELLTGSAPFSSAFAMGDAFVVRNAVLSVPPEMPDALPETVRFALSKALAKKPDGRFAACADFVAALEGKLAIPPVGGEVAGDGRREMKPNRTAGGALAGLALLGLAAAGGVWWWRENQAGELKRIVSEQKAELERSAAERASFLKNAADDRRAREEAERKAAEHLTARDAAEASVKRMEEEKRQLSETAAAELKRRLDEAERAAKDDLRKEQSRLSEAFARQESVRTNLLVKRYAQECARLTEALKAAEERARKAEAALRISRAEAAAGRSAALRTAGAAAGPKPGAVKTLTLSDGVTLDLIYCAPGEYVYGAEGTPARMERGFWLGKHEVTQRQWESVMGENPSYFKGEDLPVDTVSWDDCRRFVAKINARLSCDARLPTEREWEYACRAATTTDYSWGQALNGDKANCDGTYPVGTEEKGAYLKKTVPVGSFAPNPWGFYCMHGNVREWCHDAYDSSRRVLRGGSWYHRPANCRSASRDGSDPAARYSNFGFRLCCSEDGFAQK